MVEIKINTISHDEVDYPFLGEFTYRVKKSKFEQTQFNAEKIQEILLKHFQDSTLSYIFVCEDFNLAGWLLLYKKNQKEVVINPGEMLGGYPIVDINAKNHEKVISSLLTGSITAIKDSEFESMELVLPLSDETKGICDLIVDSGFFLKLTYTDMTCELTDLPAPTVSGNFDFKKIKDVQYSELYKCYTASFENGKAQFFKHQDDSEKKEYFEELYMKEYADTNLSIAITEGDKLIGFSYVLEFEPHVKHISCMCVHPDYQGKGVGTLLMNYITLKAKKSGARMITLGTEPQMAAYQLYKNHGFVDGASFNIYGWIKEN